MIKKKYIQPELTVEQADIEMHIMAFSVNTNFDDDDDLDVDDDSSDPWEDAY